jgi:hypothetical protein
VVGSGDSDAVDDGSGVGVAAGTIGATMGVASLGA